MQKTLLIKSLTITVLTLVLMIPIGMIGSLVAERMARQQQVVQEISASYAGAQQLTGPVVVLPWTRTLRRWVAGSPEQPGHSEEYREHGELLFFPARLEVSGEFATDVKSRGLFEARVYQWSGTLSGSFRLPAEPALPEPQSGESLGVEWERPFLALAIDDPRGVIGMPSLQWNGEKLGFSRGSRLKLEPRGIHALLPVFAPGQQPEVVVELSLALRGTESLSLVPVADDNRIEMHSAWPHPSFGGRFLPDPESQSIGAEGFRARWSISALAADAGQQLRKAVADGCSAGCSHRLDALQVRLVEPVAIYTLSDRALKYAYLFIVLSFAAFFIFEMTRELRIHPIQYLFVGLALAVFFLLLLSLSEHLVFGLAYAIAALACSGLIAIYLEAVLEGSRRGLSFGAGLAALFGALYVLLRSEDSALMLGSLLIFGLLAVAMLVTRRVDWYALGERKVALRD